MVLFEIVMSPRLLKMPPPSAKRASPESESPEALPMRLSLTVVFARVRLPEVSMPPPNAHATGQPPHALLARARDRFRARTGDAAGDRHAVDRDGRLARRKDPADRDHRPAAADDRLARAGAGELHADVDREAARVGAGRDRDRVAVLGGGDSGRNLAERAAARADGQRGRRACRTDAGGCRRQRDDEQLLDTGALHGRLLVVVVSANHVPLPARAEETAITPASSNAA